MVTITRIHHSIVHNAMHRNSIYLMMSTWVMAVLGFFFWMVAARLYAPEQIGLATTLISATNLLSFTSLLGLNSGLIRYFPQASSRSDIVTTVFILTGSAGAALAVLLLVAMELVSPQLAFIRQPVALAIWFVAFMVFSVWNIAIESAFISYRATVFVLLKNTVLSLMKVALPLCFVSRGATGIFLAISVATVVAVCASLLVLVWRFGYRPTLSVNKHALKSMAMFSFGNYAAAILGNMPTMILPLIITNSLGPASAAHYYMAMMVANFLYIIPVATGQMLFAEGSRSGDKLTEKFKRTLRLTMALMLPAVLCVAVLGKYVLLAFGEEYYREGLQLLQLLAISGVAVSLNSICGAILNVRGRVWMLVAINGVASVLVLALAYLQASTGLTGVGLAWLIGNGAVVLPLVLAARTFMSR